MNQYLKQVTLKNKNVYVAGGLGLLGSAIVKNLAGLGAKVIVLDINKTKGLKMVKQIKGSGGKAHFEFFDVTDLPGSEVSMNKLVKKFGPMHVWINVTYPRSKDWVLPLEKMTVEYLRNNMDMHLNSYLWTGRIAALLMRRDKVKGSIIHFGSTYGVRANDLSIYEGTPMSGEITYCAIKGGVINMTRYLASYFGRYGIRANTLCPGGIFDHQNPIFVKNYERRTLLKAMGTPSQIASAVAFLASEASSYVTGAEFMVDGGWTAV